MQRNEPILLVCLTIAVFIGALLPRPGAAQTSPEPAADIGALSLPEARKRALEQNPELKALEAQVRAAEGTLKQAGAFPNPELAFEIEDFGGDLEGLRESQTTLSLAQTVETGGKRAARIRSTRLEKDVAAIECLRKKLDLVADVDRRFAELLGARERLRIAEENRATAQQVAAAVAALVEAGEVSPIEKTRAESDEALALIDVEAARRDMHIAKRALAALWGKPEPDFGEPQGALAEDAALPDEAQALARLERLPDLARWKAEIARLEVSRTLARRSRFPDLTFSAGWRRYEVTGAHAYVAGIGLPIPLFNRNTGAVIEASARLDQGRLGQEAEEVSLQSSFHTAHEALSKAVEEARILREQVLPKAGEVYNALKEGYQRGKFRLLDLLEARRGLANAKLRYVETLVRVNLAKADLERLLGMPIEDFIRECNHENDSKK
jgi:cobalt-zinc-cadmium efflux system outer membrane protein